MLVVNHILIFVFLEWTLRINAPKSRRLRHRPIKGVVQVCCSQIWRTKLARVEKAIVVWRIVKFVFYFLIRAIFSLIEQSGHICAIHPQNERMGTQVFFLFSKGVLRNVSPHWGVLKIIFHVGFVSLARKWFLISSATRRNRTSRREMTCSPLTTHIVMLAVQLVLFFDYVPKSVLICVSTPSISHYLDLRILFPTSLLSISTFASSISRWVRPWTLIVIQTDIVWALCLRNSLDFFTFFAWVVRLENIWRCCRSCAWISSSHGFVFICPFCETGRPGCRLCRSIFALFAHLLIIWGILDY